VFHAKKYFFSGDMLWYSEALGHLVGSRFHCWHDWERQMRSVAALKDYEVRGSERRGVEVVGVV